MTVTIISMSGGAVVRTLTQTQTGIGAGNLTWDGKNTMGQDVGAGVYAYKVSACDAPGPQCSDQDKSGALTLNAPTLQNWLLSVPNMQVTAGLTHSESQDGVDFAWDIYEPGLNSLGGGGHVFPTAAAHTDATSFDVNPAGPFGNWTYVLSETENATQAALNRSGTAKAALQVGVCGVVEPGAFNWAAPDAYDLDTVASYQCLEWPGKGHYAPTTIHDYPTATLLAPQLQSMNNSIVVMLDHSQGG